MATMATRRDGPMRAPHMLQIGQRRGATTIRAFRIFRTGRGADAASLTSNDAGQLTLSGVSYCFQSLRSKQF
jgi:hypothetical protein